MAVVEVRSGGVRSRRRMAGPRSWGLLVMAAGMTAAIAIAAGFFSSETAAQEYPSPSDWTIAIADRNVVLVSTSEAASSIAQERPYALIERGGNEAAHAQIAMHGGEDVVVGPSDATGFRSSATIPTIAVNAPVDADGLTALAIALLLLLASGTMGFIILRLAGPTWARHADFRDDAPYHLSSFAGAPNIRFAWDQVQERNGHRLLQTTLDVLSDRIAVLDGTGTIIAVNRAWHSFAETGGNFMSHCHVGESFIEACRAAADPQSPILARAVDAVLSGRKQEARMNHHCGDRFFRMTAVRFTHEATAHVIVAYEDVTELISARQDAHDIAGKLLSLQAEERRRIAADLHDTTAQHIVAAGLGLMHLERKASHLPGLKEAVDTMRHSLNEAQREIRTLSYLLYPPNLQAKGLAASLRHFVDGFSQRTTISGSVRIRGKVDDVPLDLQSAILRVVQEALVNVHRHAQASRVSVSLRRDEKGLYLRVADNGIGLPNPAPGRTNPPAPLGVGIPGMEARISQFNGTLAIISNAHGTTIRATIPNVSADPLSMSAQAVACRGTTVFQPGSQGFA